MSSNFTTSAPIAANGQEECRHAAREILELAGLIRGAEQFADALRSIALGLDAMEIRQGGAVTACANGISQRLAELKKLAS